MSSQLTKQEIDLLSKALRARTKVAKSAILAMAPKLKAEFEIQLRTLYPPDGDPVWNEVFNALCAEHKKCQARVEQRSEEKKFHHGSGPRSSRLAGISAIIITLSRFGTSTAVSLITKLMSLSSSRSLH